MADLSITPANVQMNENSVANSTFKAGEALVQGDVVYVSSSDNLLYKADADAESTATVFGIVVTPASTGDLVTVVTSGELDIGATLVLNTAYVLSTTAGKIFLLSDITTGKRISYIGTPRTTSILSLNIITKDFSAT